MLYLKDYACESDVPQNALTASANAVCWYAVDHAAVRVYASTPPVDMTGWQSLQPLIELPGPAMGQSAIFHYVVETDIPVTMEEELNKWYAQEHLPGLAKVPGTIRASRFMRAAGAPKYVACYDLVSAQTLERSEWLAVRNTEWSSRVRPHFQNTRRTLYCAHRP